MPRTRWQICLCLVLTAGGCKQAAKDMAEEAVRGAGPAGLQTLTAPENQQMMQDLAGSQAVRDFGGNLGQGMFEGAAAAANEPATTQPTTPDAAHGERAGPQGPPGSAGAAIMRLEPVPSAFQAAIRGAADEAREAAFGPTAQAQARDWAASMARGSVSGTAEATSRELGPAIAAMLREQIAPAMREVFRQSVQGAMEGAAGQGTAGADGSAQQPSSADIARSMSRSAALGMQDAASERGQGGAMASVQQTANRAIWVLVGLIAVLGILGVASSLGLLALALVIWRSRPRSPT